MNAQFAFENNIQYIGLNEFILSAENIYRIPDYTHKLLMKNKDLDAYCDLHLFWSDQDNDTII